MRRCVMNMNWNVHYDIHNDDSWSFSNPINDKILIWSLLDNQITTQTFCESELIVKLLGLLIHSPPKPFASELARHIRSVNEIS